MAKLLFIQGNYDIDKLGEIAPWMPVALIELASWLNEKGNEAIILDRNLYFDDNKLIRILDNFKPDIVGMTAYTSAVLKDIKKVSEIVKKNSNALVIVGGIHATLEPKSLLDLKTIDYAVRGEGEGAILDICNLINKRKATRKNILKIKNINYNEIRPFMDLNELPVTNYDLIEVKKYPIATFCTSRGCPGRCRFCYNLGRTLRFYNTDKVIETMTRTIEKYNIKEFTIADDNFANLSNRTAKICEALSKYNIIFHIFLRVDQVHDKVMRELKKAGCWSIQFGFESGSQKVLDFINKNATVEQSIHAIKQCKKYKIFVDSSFMVGLPGETIEDMKKTEEFIKKYKPDAVDIKIYRPYPSTELYRESVKQGLLKEPKTIDEWITFGDLKEGSMNLSKIPTPILLKTVNELSKTNYLTYTKKAVLLMRNGHFRYVLFRLGTILKNKLGLRRDDQKTEKF